MRPIAKGRPKGQGIWACAPHPVVLLLPAVILVAFVYFVTLPYMVQLSLLSLAGALCILAAFSTLARHDQRRSERLLVDTVPMLVGHDIMPALLADEGGTVLYANEAARTKLPAKADQGIAARLATFIANPDAVLFRLQKKAKTLAAAQEDVVTRAGQYRIAVSRISPDRFLWRFDDLGATGQSKDRDSSSAGLPMLTVGRSDAVLYLNDRLRLLLAKRPKTLAEVFGPEPLKSGDVRRLKTAVDTVMDCVVAVVPGSSGRRDIFVLPTSAGQIAPKAANDSAGPGWQAIEDLPVPLMKIATDGMILASNREARALLSIQSTAGKRVTEILDGLGRPVLDWIKETADQRSGHSSNFLRGRSGHQNTFLQVTLNNSHSDVDGHHLIAVLNDVTELKTLEAQFVQSQKMHAIGQLAGGVAHDFNNLLTAISGHCDLLLLRHDQGDQDYGDLVQIHQNANRAASLVGQLLAFSRKQNLQPELIDLRDTLSDLTHLLNRLVGEKVTLTLRHDPNLAPIKADKRQLEQVIMNLVVNARDAMPGGGAIKVMTANVTLETEIERDRAFIPAGDYVEVRVIDEGQGIPPERLPKIFEPFFTTKRMGEGTGLGLSTAYGIVKQTGGFIFADSRVDEGTTFTLLFPHCELPSEEVVEPQPPQPLPIAAEDDGVVLLVEDEAPVRAFASRALRLRGYTVLEADCAETALEMLEDPDVVVDIFVTDVIMPGKDGPTWVREALKSRPDTKVVFVSGYSEDAFSDGEDKIPNSVFLPKPFSLNQLTTTVHGQLHEAAA